MRFYIEIASPTRLSAKPCLKKSVCSLFWKIVAAYRRQCDKGSREENY